MGFDISGCNPTQQTPFPKVCTDLQDKYQENEDDMFWLDKVTDLERSKYFFNHTKWQTENVGEYFRSQVWMWGTALDFIEFACKQQGDFLTEEDFKGCSYNDYYYINEIKAKKMSDAIHKAIDNETLKSFYNEYAAYKKSEGYTHEDDCPKKTIKSPLGDVTAPADGYREFFSYDRIKNHIQNFANFANSSGGFTVG